MDKLKPFDEGVLCFVVRRKYQSKGNPVLILHEAKAKKFGYGAFRTWTTALRATIDRSQLAAQLGSIGGQSKSPAKSAASRINIANARAKIKRNTK